MSAPQDDRIDARSTEATVGSISARERALIAALRFYASSTNCRRGVFGEMTRNGNRNTWERDEGKIAREVLADLPSGIEPEADPGRLLKEALFACLKAGTASQQYGGVEAGDGKYAWVRFSVDDAAERNAGPPANLAKGMDVPVSITRLDEAMRAVLGPEHFDAVRSSRSFVRPHVHRDALAEAFMQRLDNEDAEVLRVMYSALHKTGSYPQASWVELKAGSVEANDTPPICDSQDTRDYDRLTRHI